MQKTTIWKRWGQAVLVPVIVFATIGSILGVAYVQVTHSQQLTRHTQEVKAKLATLYTIMQEAEAGTRGYLLSGQDIYLDQYNQAMREVPNDLDTLQQMIADNPRQVENVKKLHEATERRMNQFAASIRTTDAGNLAAVVAGMRNGAGRAAMTGIHDAVEAMTAEEDRLLELRRQAVGRSIGFLVFFAYGILFVIMTIAVFGLAYARRRSEELEVARDALRISNEKLTGEIAERTKVEDQLRQVQKMEAIGQLTGGIAHDFNNMLAVIMGALNIMQRRIDRGDYNVGTFVQAAIEGAQRGGALTQRLLAFARKQVLEPRSIDPNKLVSGMSDLLRRTLGEIVQTEVILAGGLWRIFADAHQLETTILNLVVNARDAMPEGGKLTIETANAHLDEVYATQHRDVPPGQYVMIGVTDTGTGMAPEVLAKAFDPFFTTKGSGRGTGLGLSQVYGFVKQSGGHVKIYSEIGHGATIKVYLPRHHGQTDDSVIFKPVDSINLPKGSATETILVVEDEEGVRRLAVDSLTELGYTVIEADGAEQGLKLLDRHPSVIMLFTDIVMPGVNGRQLADEATKRRPSLKVLYTTGYTRNAVVHNGTLDPGVRLLGKPYTLDQLARTVRDILDG